MSERRIADFSPCRLYRYRLLIQWDESLPLCQFVGLNPSTADEVKDDPTIRRCKGFCRTWRFGGLIMTNLFAFRSTLPKHMLRHPSPIGDDNDFWLGECQKQAGLTVAAWGKDGNHLSRAYYVTKMLPPMKCLGRNKNGTPVHPLYQPEDAQLQDYKLT